MVVAPDSMGYPSWGLGLGLKHSANVPTGSSLLMKISDAMPAAPCRLCYDSGVKNRDDEISISILMLAGILRLVEGLPYADFPQDTPLALTLIYAFIYLPSMLHSPTAPSLTRTLARRRRRPGQDSPFSLPLPRDTIVSAQELHLPLSYLS